MNLLCPYIGMGFFMGRIYTSEYGYVWVVPNEYTPVAIPRCKIPSVAREALQRAEREPVP
jgi:hypothetical protein